MKIFLAGEIAFMCLETGKRCGVPDVSGRYVYRCDAWVTLDGRRVEHLEERAV